MFIFKFRVIIYFYYFLELYKGSNSIINILNYIYTLKIKILLIVINLKNNKK